MTPVAHLICGPPGSGKTTLAREIARRESAVRFTHDDWMVRLHGTSPPREEFDAHWRTVNELIWFAAAEVVSRGVSVVLDYGFWTRASRDHARARAEHVGADPKLWFVTADPGEMRRRVLSRQLRGPDAAFEVDAAGWEWLHGQWQAREDDEQGELIET